MKNAPAASDPASFEIIKNSLFKIAEEMRVVLCKTAYSPILKSAGDFSCGVFDCKGDMPSSVWKCVLRPRISRSASPTPDLTSHPSPSHHLAGVERIAQSVADEIDGQYREEDGGAGKHGPMRGNIEIILGIVEDAAPGGNIGREA